MSLPNKQTIQDTVVGVLNNMTQDWELELPEQIGPQTRLMGDLEFESIDVVQFAVSIEQAFDKKGLPFEKLFMQDGDYVSDLQVSQVIEFVDGEL